MPRTSDAIVLDKETGEYVLNLRFGGGLSSTPFAADIDLRECADGQNFDLTVDQDTFRPRQPFDLVGTAPNGSETRGFAELIDSSGNISVLVQAGSEVYQFDGLTTFTSVGNVNPGSLLRGGRRSTSLLDDQVIITDLKKLETVKTWDGTTFATLTTDLGSAFYAKYALISAERAHYANVTVGTTAYPHVVMVSGRGASAGVSALGTLTIVNRPSSSLSAADPFWLPLPDLRTINGILRVFGRVVISSEEGPIWYLLGSDATDFIFVELYADSGAFGEEAIVSIGNDVLVGRFGSIESLLGAEQFGDIVQDDPSRWIRNEISNVRGWQIVYNSRTHRAYCWPKDGQRVHVFAQSLYQPLQKSPTIQQLGVSPWTPYVTALGNFQTKAAQLIRRPTDGQDVIYFGGPAGQVYQMEGDGGQDGGSQDITTKRLSGLIEVPPRGLSLVKGKVKYRKADAVTLTLRFKFQGIGLFEETVTIALPAADNAVAWGQSDAYWGETDKYWGIEEFGSNLSLRNFEVPGRATMMQVEVEMAGASDVEIAEIELRWQAADQYG